MATMVSDAEQRLAERGMPIDEWTEGGWPGPQYEGVLILTPLGAERWMGARTACYVRAGLSAEDRARFAEWIETRVDAYFDIGPEADGWTSRSDGGWQLLGRLARMPDMSWLDDEGRARH